ncbi:hypothetical protein [Priestia endophytica]|uniref:hypothetical protein n=1 Tax=Priestia endophytica TaxID=135735 RepID=UPI00124F4FC9|nr:hypothetical protein [Priestia endophytica]KAB2489982.1 hypothetical protein F8155_21565 [Priestia endophytica]MCY8232886.1 hypothetical protein [Priestia endophytica]
MESQIEKTVVNEDKQKIYETNALKRFLISIWRTETLLSVSIKGLESELEEHQDILTKIGKVLNGEKSEDNIQSEEELIELELNERELMLIKASMDYSHEEHSILDKYIFSILTVFVWGTLETYLYQAFSELFRKNPSMLKTEKNNFNTNEILDNLEDPLSLLINKEMNKVGHFKLNDWAKYLDKMLKYNIDLNDLEVLKGIYLVRNIVAHNTGVVRPDQYLHIPSEIEVIDDEIVVSNKFLSKAIDTIRRVVVQLDQHIVKKHYKSN